MELRSQTAMTGPSFQNPFVLLSLWLETYGVSHIILGLLFLVV